jgi:hypothetical protein
MGQSAWFTYLGESHLLNPLIQPVHTLLLLLEHFYISTVLVIFGIYV